MWLTTKQQLNHRACWAPGSSCLAANFQEISHFRGLSMTTLPTLGQSDVAFAFNKWPYRASPAFSVSSLGIPLPKNFLFLCFLSTAKHIVVTDRAYYIQRLVIQQLLWTRLVLKLSYTFVSFALFMINLFILNKEKLCWIRSLVPGSLLFCYMVS